jgi:hypothetical protein
MSGVFFQPAFKKNIVGRTIMACVELDVGGDEDMPALRLDNGALLIIKRDAEGNGGGFMVLIDKNEKDIGCGGAE